MDTSTTERDLGRVEGKLDIALATLTRLEQKWDKRDERVERRLYKLETRYKVAIAIGASSFVAALGDAKHVAIALLHTVL